ncbi:NUDIX hydrolase [Nonomuraea helvata]|uniref:NUDIX hydrolase n=1 Tax=Nonomuraea helvata TaxID=37484 RepID=A0ABV5RYN9_9ACTN
MPEPIMRPTARILLVDSDDRILLFQGQGPTKNPDVAWFAPGGGVHAGESVVVAAARELWEETGLQVGPEALEPVVAVSEGYWIHSDDTLYYTTDHYFLLRTQTVTVDLSAMEGPERSRLAAYRWWTLDELRATTDTMIPRNLPELLEPLLKGVLPAQPYVIPWHHPAPVAFTAARVIVVDDENRVLLYRAPRLANDHLAWFTPGGRLEPGETPETAAARELREEIGHHLEPGDLGPVVALNAGVWVRNDGLLMRSEHHFFFHRVPTLKVDISGMEEFERSRLDCFHWWTLDELRSATEPVLPVDLPRLLERLVAGDVPKDPVLLAWDR